MNHQQGYDIFISYRHETGFYMAQILYTHFITNGYTVFMDKTMQSGRYEDKIRDAIAESRNFVVVLFPEDEKQLGNGDSWLTKEATWALENPNINIIPIMCDGFNWPGDDSLTDALIAVKKSNGIPVHKDYSLDSDLDTLCDKFLKNVSPAKPKITTDEFFKYNLQARTDLNVLGVDVAFHGGGAWLFPGEKNSLLISSLKKGIRWRVLINTVKAAKSISKHMHDDTAFYLTFPRIHAQWKKLQSLFPDALEVRACPIPLIHVHHAIHLEHQNNGQKYSEQHIRYYAYNNMRLDNAFEHRLSSYSKYYRIYSDEFEFLWEQSERI